MTENFVICQMFSAVEKMLSGYCFVIICTIVAVEGSSFSNDESKSLSHCTGHGSINGFAICAAEKALKMVEVASEKGKLVLLPGVELIRKFPLPTRTAKDVKMPANPKKRPENTIELLVDATARFISERILQINFPRSSTETISRAIEEGRGKLKKLNILMKGLGALITFIVPLLMGGISLLSAKALVVGKVALVLSLILFVQNFFMGGTNMLPPYVYGPSTSYGVPPVNIPYGPGSNTLGGWNYQEKYPYSRSFASDMKNREIK